MPRQNHISTGWFLCYMASTSVLAESHTDWPLTLVYSQFHGEHRDIFLADEHGKTSLQVTDFGGTAGYPSVSPDGRRIAFYGKYDDYKTWSIHTVRTDGSDLRRLTDVKHVWDSAPSWSPDGKTIVFAREYEDDKNAWQEEIWLMDADGNNLRQVKPLQGRAPIFLPDGRLLFHSKTGPSQICIADSDGNNLLTLTDNQFNDWSPKLSPDGTKIAFLSNRDGNQELYTMNLDGSDQTRLTNNDRDDWDPAWSADGQYLFFSNTDTDNKLFMYRINANGTELQKFAANAFQASRVNRLDKAATARLRAAKRDN